MLVMTNTTDTHLPTIVYVEDNDGDTLLLEEALRARGHKAQLLVIEKGDSALHYFQVKETAKDVPPPHCILLDNHLPVVSGMALLTFIRSAPIFDKTPVYIFANVSLYTDAVTSGLISRDSFLVKPASWAGFLKLADHVMRSAELTMHEIPHGKPEIRPPSDLHA
jgi:DNA-binding response OmpR family regulator